MATQTLATWASTLSASCLPSPVLDAARRSLYNYMGCTIGGSTHPTVRKAQSALSPLFGAAATSTLLGTRGLQADAQHAALLNGMASHVHDYDDTRTWRPSSTPRAPVASALLAYVQLRCSPAYVASFPSLGEGQDNAHPDLTPPPVSGALFLTALTAGIEASCKLGRAVWPSHYDVGWHITSTTGSIGAAVAVGRLMNLSPAAMAHAISIAAVQLPPGRAAQNGLLAALLAERGFTSSEAALEAKRGWGEVVLGPGSGAEAQFERYLGELGSVWEVLKNAFKPFPCGIVAHPAVDGCIQVWRELVGRGLDARRDVQSVRERVHPLAIELTSKREPKDGLEGRFSVFHGSAVGLLYGKAGPAQYADEVVRSADVVALREKIEAEADEGLKADEALIQVKLRNGEVLNKHVVHAVGSLESPMSDEALEEKFIDQAALVLGRERAEEASQAARWIGYADDVVEVIGRL